METWVNSSRKSTVLLQSAREAFCAHVGGVKAVRHPLRQEHARDRPVAEFAAAAVEDLDFGAYLERVPHEAHEIAVVFLARMVGAGEAGLVVVERRAFAPGLVAPGLEVVLGEPGEARLLLPAVRKHDVVGPAVLAPGVLAIDDRKLAVQDIVDHPLAGLARAQVKAPFVEHEVPLALANGPDQLRHVRLAGSI